jgi:predicted phosphodiesterase
MKVLAVGDIHTKLWIIDEVEKIIDNYDAVVFVGDYADDWNASPLRTIETYIKLHDFQVKYFNKVHVIMGNHDYIYVNNIPMKSSGYNYSTQHLLNMPENKKYKAWISAMPILREIDGVIYTHAGITDAWEYEGEIRSHGSPLWARPGDSIDSTDRYGTDKYLNIPQVFGHTPSDTCWEVQPNVWCIDTFSTYQDGTPVGDWTVLEIEDGTKFTKRKIQNDNNNTNRFKR